MFLWRLFLSVYYIHITRKGKSILLFFPLILNYYIRSLYSQTNSYDNAVTQCHVDHNAIPRAWATCDITPRAWDHTLSLPNLILPIKYPFVNCSDQSGSLFYFSSRYFEAWAPFPVFWMKLLFDCDWNQIPRTSCHSVIDRPFYSLLGGLVFEWQRGWKWPCSDTDLCAFFV